MRTPYFDLPGYMCRWWLRKPPGHGEKESTYETGVSGIGIRVHHTLRSDRGRDNHCHPWWNITVVLFGGFYELMPRDQNQPAELDGKREHTKVKWRGPGSIVIRRATDRHRLVLLPYQDAWTLFIMGPWKRDWGFHTAAGWVQWREYLGIPKVED